MNYQKYYSTPDSLNSADPSFPGFPIQGSQNSIRQTWATSLRSTLGPNLVNEVHGGYTNSFVVVLPRSHAECVPGPLGRRDERRGVQHRQRAPDGRLREHPDAGVSEPQHPGTREPDDLDGRHVELAEGRRTASAWAVRFTHIGLHSYNQNVVPQVIPGIAPGDPALACSRPPTSPARRTTNLNAAQNLYAILTGHIASIGSTAVLDENERPVLVRRKRRQPRSADRVRLLRAGLVARARRT